jgi:hypothetical protein
MTPANQDLDAIHPLVWADMPSANSTTCIKLNAEPQRLVLKLLFCRGGLAWLHLPHTW